MCTFKRRFGGSLITRLRKEPLYTECLLPDGKDKYDVFPAIRNETIDFYHRGGKLFQYDQSGFRTHIKYASVISGNQSEYLTQKELKNHSVIPDFLKEYIRIKENCANYSGVEAIGVSEIYHRFPYFNGRSNVVILDIEVSLQSVSNGIRDRTQDRIDLLLFNKAQKELKFVEVKHYSNNEIRSRSTYPKVLDQIKRYKNQLSAKKGNIIDEYGNYVRIINGLFELDLPIPKELDEDVTLLIFGFDNDQKNGRLAKQIVHNSSLIGMKYFAIGNIKRIRSMESLWKSKVIR